MVLSRQPPSLSVLMIQATPEPGGAFAKNYQHREIYGYFLEEYHHLVLCEQRIRYGIGKTLEQQINESLGIQHETLRSPVS
jgi:hypothetical protein